MNTEDLQVGAFFTTNKKDVWKLQSFCLEPTCELKNLETGEIQSFGLGGITSQLFQRIKELKSLEDE